MILHSHIFQHHHLRHRQRRDDIPYYASSVIHEIGISMVAIFILLHLYQLGWSLEVVLGYAIIWSLAQVVFSHHLLLTMLAIGVKKQIFLSNIVTFLVIVGLFLVDGPGQTPLLAIFLLAALHGINYRQYWVGSDYYMIKTYKQKSGGHSSGLFMGLIVAATTTGPLIGGLVTEIFNIQTAIVLAGIVIGLSVIPLGFSSHKDMFKKQPNKIRDQANWSNYRRIWKSLPKRMSLATSLNWSHNMIMVTCWLLYMGVVVFVGDQTFGLLGVLMTTSGLIYALVSIATGNLEDHGHGRKFLGASLGSQIVLSGWRIFGINSPTPAVSHDLISSPANAGVQTAALKNYCDIYHPPDKTIGSILTTSLQMLVVTLVMLLILGLVVIWPEDQDPIGVMAAVSGVSGIVVALLSFVFIKKKKPASTANRVSD